MEKDTIMFFRTDQLANNALAQFIFNHIIVDARMVTFTDDDYIHNFIYVGMAEREWWGVMYGIRVTTNTGEKIVFASWDDGVEWVEKSTVESSDKSDKIVSEISEEDIKNDNIERLNNLVMQSIAQMN